MYRNIAGNLRPWGRFIALTVDSQFQHGARNTEKYGFSVAPAVDPQDEDQLWFTMFSDPPQTVACHHWERSTHEHIAREAGLHVVQWHPLQVSPAKAQGPDLFHDLLENSPFVVLSAQRR